MNRSCNSKKFPTGLLLFLVGLFFCTAAEAVSSVSLQWNPNMDPSVIGYNVYYGTTSRGYTNSISAGNVTNAVVGGLIEGKTYYFAITAYDAFGDESDYSDETVFIVPGFLTLTPGQNPGDPAQIRFPVAATHWYELQASADLINWNTMWQVVGVSNIWVEYDATVNAASSQFFRVIIH